MLEQSEYYNQILRGDCLDIMPQLPAASFDMVFVDPPYNLQLRGALVRPEGSTVDAVTDAWDQFGDFPSYDRFTLQWLKEVKRLLKPAGTVWVIGTYHNIYRIGKIMQDLEFWLLNDILWCKSNPMPNFRGRRFTNAHETLLWCTKDHAVKNYTFNYQELKALNGGKQMRSDWFIPICSGKERLRDLQGNKVHSTQKPEALLYQVMIASTNPDDLVLDPFLGTGTTAAVAKKLGRNYVGIEKSAKYAEAAERRLAGVEPLASIHLTKSILRPETQIKLGNLVAHGRIEPGTVLVDGKRRHRIEVKRDGMVEYRGVRCTPDEVCRLLGYGKKSVPDFWQFWRMQVGEQWIPVGKLCEGL